MSRRTKSKKQIASEAMARLAVKKSKNQIRAEQRKQKGSKVSNQQSPLVVKRDNLVKGIYESAPHSSRGYDEPAIVVGSLADEFGDLSIALNIADDVVAEACCGCGNSSSYQAED